MYVYLVGHGVAQLCKKLPYKPEGHGFDSRWCPSGRTLALGSAQTLTEMSTGNISWEVNAVSV
jgi:hypothetical protein